MADFSQIPILDLSRARNADTKAAFLAELRHALLHVGFLYLSQTGVDAGLVADVVRLCKAFFDLPEAEKLRIEMKNCLPSLRIPRSCVAGRIADSLALQPHTSSAIRGWGTKCWPPPHLKIVG